MKAEKLQEIEKAELLENFKIEELEERCEQTMYWDMYRWGFYETKLY